MGVEKGFFKEFGVEPELVYFQAKLWIVADKGREWPGYPLTAIIVQKDLWDGGLRSVPDLKGKRIGVTSLGSTFHYHLGNVLEKHGLTLNDVKIVPLQAMGAALEVLKGKQVEAIALAQPFPARAEAEGFGKILAWGGDLFPFQAATVFYSNKFRRRPDQGRQLHEGLRQVVALLLRQRARPEGRANQAGAALRRGARHHREIHRGAARGGQGRLPVSGPQRAALGRGRREADDVVAEARVHERVIPLKQIVDSSFVDAAVRAVGE